MNYEAVIGLEVHAQVHTRTKMYCGCPVVEDTGDLPPNTCVCPVCLALPGALPVVNRHAVAYGVAAALALNCTVHATSIFARKSYFYPDLPKGYQISQYAHPLATDGYLLLSDDLTGERVGITRVHLEEDTAKLYHREGQDLVDFNRAGVPLLEIVSEPEMHTAEQVLAYATALRELLIYLGVNTGDLEKGMLRFEANISLRPEGTTALGTRTEIKNLNSFRALTRAVEYEITRQQEVLAAGGRIAQETLGWDEGREQTYPQRSKEHAHDYRYFPEPDIPPLHVDLAWQQEIAATLPELPQARRQRWIAEYGIRSYDAALLAATPAIAAYFEAAVALAEATGLSPQELANWITGELFRLLNEHDQAIDTQRVTPRLLCELLGLCQQKIISVTAAKTVLAEIFHTGDAPQAIVERLGLAQLSDADALTTIIMEVLSANPQQVAQYLDGKEAVLGWFVGQVMGRSRGKANPTQAHQLLQQHLEQRRSS
ncbi:MAG TPA: Asp-tRNA(Asn)/Glu-tRNA(Gln) amidotransferase subunit GatB [Chloroflexi bacterium]|nr:Asp-tRNA(Asn)/Glu-tRNA(Gln) amidotransferase subunit GatB [Chloroflexota bacterium]